MAIAMVTLLLGLAIGFFVGRSYDESSGGPSASPLTVPESVPTTERPPGDTVPQPNPSTTAPSGTELAPATIGSLEDPIPVGQAYVLGLYEIEVLAGDRDAGPVLQEFDPSNPAPADGHRHVLVEISVRFTDADGLGNPASIPFFVSDGNSRWFAFDSTCGRVPDDLTEVGFVEQGEETTGHICFTVPADATDDLLFGTEGFAGPLYFALPG